MNTIGGQIKSHNLLKIKKIVDEDNNDDKFIEKVKEAYEKNNINEKTYNKIMSEHLVILVSF